MILLLDSARERPGLYTVIMDSGLPAQGHWRLKTGGNETRFVWFNNLLQGTLAPPVNSEPLAAFFGPHCICWDQRLLKIDER